jgi:hypothetical protein
MTVPTDAPDLSCTVELASVCFGSSTVERETPALAVLLACVPASALPRASVAASAPVVDYLPEAPASADVPALPVTDPLTPSAPTALPADVPAVAPV